MRAIQQSEPTDLTVIIHVIHVPVSHSVMITLPGWFESNVSVDGLLVVLGSGDLLRAVRLPKLIRSGDNILLSTTQS